MASSSFSTEECEGTVFLWPTYYVHTIVFCGENVRIYKGKVGSAKFFCPGTVVTIRVTENSPAIKILHERDLMVYQECPPGFCVKDYFSFFNFAINIVNFRLYANPWQTLGAASWQTTASSFWITWLYKPCLYSQCAYWLLPLGLVYYIHSLLGLSVVLGLPLISAFFLLFPISLLSQ